MFQVKTIAKELGITPAQVYVSWHVQRGVCSLPIMDVLSLIMH